MGGRSGSFKHSGGAALPKDGYFTYDTGLTQEEYDKHQEFYSKRGNIESEQNRKIESILAPYERKADENSAYHNKHEYDTTGLKVTRIPGNKKYGVADKFIVPGKDGKTIRVLGKGYPENVPVGVKAHFGYGVSVHTFKGEHVPTHYSIVRDSHGRRKKIEGYTKWSKDTVGGSLTSEEKKMITKYGNRIEGSFRLK